MMKFDERFKPMICKWMNIMNDKGYQSCYEFHENPMKARKL